MTRFASSSLGIGAASIFLALVLAATPAAAQKKKKTPAPDPDTQSEISSVMPPVPDAQAVERAVGEMLGYWQIGDIDSLHKYYADNIVVVSGAWEPPVIGWDNFVRDYQAQRASVTGQRIERLNTYTKVSGSFAWATYQFVYEAVANGGKTVQFRGHTTLVLNKVGDRWVIVLNHSSIVDSNTATPAPPAGLTPTPSAGAAQPGQP